MNENCRFCLKDMAFSEKFHEIDDQIKKDFMHVTNTELLVSRCYINIICEMCLRSLQLASILKSQLIENQEKFHRDFDISTTKFEDEYYEEQIPVGKRKRRNKKSVTPKYSEEESLLEEIKTKQEIVKETVMIENPQIYEQSEPTFPCQICNKHFSEKIELDIHEVTHSNENVVCTIFDKKLKSQNLNAYEYHHSERKFQCDECGKSYSDKTALHDHVRCVHMHAKVYKCKFCSKSYFKNNSLNRHIKSIHKRQTFYCSFPGCMKNFNFKYDCKVHIKRKHPNVKTDKILDLVKQNKGNP